MQYTVKKPINNNILRVVTSFFKIPQLSKTFFVTSLTADR